MADILAVMTVSRDQNIRVRRLGNGITLVFEHMPWLRSLSMAFLAPAGSATDPDGREGSAAVLSEWMSRGAGDLDSRAFNDALEGLGVRRGGGAGRETTSVTASMLASSLPQALPLLADLLRRPRLDDDEFANSRELAQQELASLEDSPAQRLSEALTAAFFTSPHRRSSYGTLEGLAGLDEDGVRQDYAARFRPEGMIIAAAGGVDWDDLVRQVEEQFGDWQGAPPPLPSVSVARAGRNHVEADTSQVQIGLAYPGVAPGDDDWYRHTLAMNVLSGGAGSRLFMEVREKRGLVYSVHAVPRALRGFGYVLARAGTTPERADETLEVMMREIDHLGKGVEADELERSRIGILSQLVMQGESSGARAAGLAHDIHLRGEPRTLQEVKDAIASVGLEDVNSFLAARETPNPTILTLGPAVAEVG